MTREYSPDANKAVSRAPFIRGNESSREATSIHRSTPPFPPESMLHEFTAETTRSRNTALQPIFVELPRFVNDKGSKDIFRHAANRSTDCRGPENDSYRVPHFRFHARKWNKRELDIYILFNLDGRYRTVRI